MTEQIERTAVIPARPEAIFDAWIAGEGHTEMTGSAASSSPEVGGAFTAWNGFIWGTWTALERPSRIAMTWTTRAFPEGAAPSQVEVLLESRGSGTQITVKHHSIPKGQGDNYYEGWREKYFEPMTAHFGATPAD